MVILPELAERNEMALLMKAVQETCVALHLEFDHGYSEEGDPWWCAIAPTGQTVAHLARERLPNGEHVYHYMHTEPGGCEHLTRNSLKELYDDFKVVHARAKARVSDILIRQGNKPDAVKRSMDYSTRKRGQLKLLRVA